MPPPPLTFDRAPRVVLLVRSILVARMLAVTLTIARLVGLHTSRRA